MKGAGCQHECGCASRRSLWSSGLNSLSPPRWEEKVVWELAPVAHFREGRQRDQSVFALAGAKGSLRVSMCQIASEIRRATSTWANLCAALFTQAELVAFVAVAKDVA